jgi:hypothetical protein
MTEFTDLQVIAALRAWWNLEPGERMPWDCAPDVTNFQVSSMRDMRAALEAGTPSNSAQAE